MNGVFLFRGVFGLIPIRFLRKHDRMVRRKPWMPRNPVVRRKTQLRTNVTRQFPGFVGNFDTGLPQ